MEASETPLFSASVEMEKYCASPGCAKIKSTSFGNILAISFIILVLCVWRSYMKITLLSKPGFSGNMLVRKIEEVAKSQLMDIEVFLNEHLQEADVVLLTPQRCEDLKEIKKVVKVPVGVISLKDYGLLDGSSIIKYAKQLIQK